jgi:hypothetical protein
MTDQDILFKLRNDSSYFSKIYDDYKSSSLNFMRKMNSDYVEKTLMLTTQKRIKVTTRKRSMLTTQKRIMLTT